MVDNSELLFCMLCRKYGVEATYEPMLHSRICIEIPKYRYEEFTTCKVHYLSDFVQMIMIHYLKLQGELNLIVIMSTLIRAIRIGLPDEAITELS
ncbi:hypothetical protein V6N13_034603 [Hibiscus sabdariffa]